MHGFIVVLKQHPGIEASTVQDGAETEEKLRKSPAGQLMAEIAWALETLNLLKSSSFRRRRVEATVSSAHPHLQPLNPDARSADSETCAP